MSVDAHNIKEEVKKYWIVFALLLVLTVVTVAASNFQIGVTLGIALALMIATVKGTLVARNFMHLSSEKKLIYLVLILAAVFFIVMISLICFSHFSNPEGLTYVT